MKCGNTTQYNAYVIVATNEMQSRTLFHLVDNSTINSNGNKYKGLPAKT